MKIWMCRNNKLTIVILALIALGERDMCAQMSTVHAEQALEVVNQVRTEKIKQEHMLELKRQRLLSVPAELEVEDVYPDGSRVRFRKVAKPYLEPQPVVALQQPVPRISNPAAVLGHPPKTINITLTITPAENGHSLLQWKEGEHSWQIRTNADLRGLEHAHRIPLDRAVMSVFILNLQTEAAEVSEEVYFEIIGEQAPAKLVKQIEALHDYYLQHQQQMQRKWFQVRALEQARLDWEATHPETPQETVINFFKIR